MTAPAVQVRGLTKTFGEIKAVRGIDLEVPTGEMFGFLGPNGAGKTTTIKILCTLADATSGTATVAGYDVATEKAAVRSRIGLVFQEPTLDTYLTAEQNLRFHGEMYGVPRDRMRRRMDDVLDKVGLADRRRDLVRKYSGGMRRRLEIARGLLHTPTVLFLDEPTIGLDPQTRAAIWDYIRVLRDTEEITVFLTTHYMEEAEYCDRIAIIDNGEIVAIDTPEALKAAVGADRIQISTDDDPAAIRQLKERLGLEAAMHDGMVTLAVPGGAQFVPRLFADLDIGIGTVTVHRPSLDDVFMAYTGRTIRDAEKGGGAPHPLQLMAAGRR
jgi:ABC-2 type transport system ATP-binding protein